MLYNLFFGKSFCGIGVGPCYVIDENNILVFTLIPLIELFFSKSIRKKIILVVIIIVIFLFQKIDRYNSIPYGACNAAYNCQKTNRKIIYKCSYCKDVYKDNTCKKEISIECELNNN